jgi:hypothetical protein
MANQCGEIIPAKPNYIVKEDQIESGTLGVSPLNFWFCLPRLKVKPPSSSTIVSFAGCCGGDGCGCGCGGRGGGADDIQLPIASSEDLA